MLRSTFGETLSGPLAEIVVRNWGAMLIARAFNPPVRSFAVVVAGTGKLVFIAFVLSHGGHYCGHQSGLAIVIDLAWVVLFAWYLSGVRAALV